MVWKRKESPHEDDKRAQIDCDRVGNDGHHLCGICDIHYKPRYECQGCMVFGEELPQIKQIVERVIGKREKEHNETMIRIDSGLWDVLKQHFPELVNQPSVYQEREAVEKCIKVLMQWVAKAKGKLMD